METIEDVLAHFGVKGMKWGVHREGKHPISEDAKSAGDALTKSKKSGVHSLSNKELQSLVNRMNLEQQFSRLNKDRIDKGEKAVKQILSVGRTAFEAYTLLNKTGVLTNISKVLGR
jgi:hypothetical protein